MDANKDIKAMQDEDLKLSSTLNSIRENGEPYQVPPGYFSKLEDDVLSGIQTKNESVFNLVLNRLKRPQVSVPIGLALVAITLLLLTKKPAEEINIINPQISQEELINSGILLDMDEDLLLESYFSALPEQANLTEEAVFFNEAEQYLIDNKMDVNLIMNEL